MTAPLNYGYAILRSGIAQCAVSHGWLVSRGIHHHSAENAFNLVDDLIEPFRPIVDLKVVYSRNLLSRASSESHAEQLRKHLPPAGHVVAMELTEKQYVDRKVLVNTNPFNDRDDQSPGTQLFLEF